MTAISIANLLSTNTNLIWAYITLRLNNSNNIIVNFHNMHFLPHPFYGLFYIKFTLFDSAFITLFLYSKAFFYFITSLYI